MKYMRQAVLIVDPQQDFAVRVKAFESIFQNEELLKFRHLIAFPHGWLCAEQDCISTRKKGFCQWKQGSAFWEEKISFQKEVALNIVTVQKRKNLIIQGRRSEGEKRMRGGNLLPEFLTKKGLLLREWDCWEEAISSTSECFYLSTLRWCSCQSSNVEYFQFRFCQRICIDHFRSFPCHWSRAEHSRTENWPCCFVSQNCCCCAGHWRWFSWDPHQ